MDASTRFNPAAAGSIVRAMVGALLAACLSTTWAQSTDIAKSPLFTTQANTVKPNLLFILDDSGSMDYNYMPDEVNDSLQSGAYGRKSAQCNGVAYDPAYTYTPPLYADGTSYANATFGAAWNDGFSPGTGGTSNLDNSTYYRYSGSQPKMGWTFTATGPITTTTFYRECNSKPGNAPGNAVFTQVTVTSTSAEAQNYANWYSYYRTRMLMMKTAVGVAFNGIDKNYRVGFTTIDRKLPLLNVADFDTTQKGSFYTQLYGSNPTGWTPLRGALSKAGQYYANKASGQVSDPVQYSCQHNYTLLSTDGYWNTNAESANNGASNNYGAYRLDNTTLVSQQDGAGTDRPYFDGEQVNKTDTYQWSRVDSTPTTTATPRTVTTIPGPSTTTATPKSLNTQDYYYSSSGCNCNWNRVCARKQSQQQIVYGINATSTSPSTIDRYVDNQVVTSYSTQNFTETITYINGAQTSDLTSSTTTANSPAATTTTNTTGPTTTIGSTTTTFDYTSNWANVGSSSKVCVSSSPALPYTANLQTGLTPTSTAPITSTTAGTQTFTATGTATVTTGANAQGTPTAKTLSSSSTTTSGGSSNSLADVAMYYYSTDLRDSSLSNCTGALGTSVCANNVNAAKDDQAAWQHMTTFTLGLGAGSSLAYTFDYQTRKSGDYYDILQGTKNWPVASADSPTAIDDLWHAAVNGRGRFFSVQNAKELAAGLDATLDQIRATTGSASAAATSTLQPVQGDNDVFVAQFTTVTWVGEIKKFSIDPSTGVISPVANWSIQAALENKLPSARNIYYKAATGNQLMAFTTANLTADGYLGNFSNFCSKTGAAGSGNPAQCGSLAAADVTSANTADNLVNFLRGDKSATYYRIRDKILGDIVNASPLFVGKPSNAFTENNYAAFKTANSTRLGVVYAAANDGMLHAFRRDTGEELWAYIPTPMLSKLYKLADTSYSDNHDYFVDGTPTSGDAYIGGQWRTILVGGYRAGGKGYYALDITDPLNPKSLWEFSDADMGLSFGNPIITKRADGTWVVAFASGYNNNTGSGDGNGHLYVVNAADGSLLKKLNTYTDTAGTVAAGTTAAPSGLAMINVWVDFDTENLAKRFYGVDLLGNVWRFDIDSNVQPYNSAFLLAQLRDGSGTPQPATTLPILAEVPYLGTNYPIVYVATGEYLGLSDLTTTQQQSSYAFVDPLTATGYGDIRAANVLLKTGSSTTAVDWQTKKGWLYDYPTTGERANVNSVIALSTITTPTNVPSTDLCALGGSSFIYNFDLLSGKYKAYSMGATLTVGATVVQLAADGASAGATVTISTNSKGDVKTTDNTSSSGSVILRRTSWRELD